MKIIRLTILILVLTGSWAATAMGMPASDPDMLVTKAGKAASAPAGGSDWTYAVVGVAAAVVVLIASTLIGRRRTHTGAPVQA